MKTTLTSFFLATIILSFSIVSTAENPTTTIPDTGVDLVLPERWYSTFTPTRAYDKKNQANIIVYTESESEYPSIEAWLDSDLTKVYNRYSEGYDYQKKKPKNTTMKIESGETVSVRYQSLKFGRALRETASIYFTNAGKYIHVFVGNMGKRKKLNKIVEETIVPGIRIQ